MFKIHPEIPESMSPEAKAFIVRCFEPDPDRRATAFDLLTDEFLTVTSRKKRSKSSFTGEYASVCSSDLFIELLGVPVYQSRDVKMSGKKFKGFCLCVYIIPPPGFYCNHEPFCSVEH